MSLYNCLITNLLCTVEIKKTSQYSSSNYCVASEVMTSSSRSNYEFFGDIIHTVRCTVNIPSVIVVNDHNYGVLQRVVCLWTVYSPQLRHTTTFFDFYCMSRYKNISLVHVHTTFIDHLKCYIVEIDDNTAPPITYSVYFYNDF